MGSRTRIASQNQLLRRFSPVLQQDNSPDRWPLFHRLRRNLTQPHRLNIPVTLKLIPQEAS
jgi:hypothetical protein